jgi:hypothetical protein
MNKMSAIAIAASLLVTSAMAIEGPAAFVPSQTGATYPNTVAPATAWKLVGSLGASAVQIAPRWLLTAKHVGVGVTNGQTFTNAYGSAQVDAVILSSKVDMALVHLATEIVVPANELPALLADQLDDSSNNLPGQMLAAGRGGFGAVKAHWLVANEDTTAVLASVSGVSAIGGDSGSGVFWYPNAQSRPVLRSITTNAGNPVGPYSVQVGTSTNTAVFDAKGWIDTSIAGYGTNSGAAPLWSTSLALAPHALRTPNLPQTSKVLQTSANGAWMQWTAPKAAAAGTPEITGYVVRLSPGGAEYNVVASNTTLTLNGLQPNKVYSATISAVNANGPSGPRPALTVYDGVNMPGPSFTTSLAPAALSSLSYEAYTKLEDGQLKGCVRFNPVFATTGVAATRFGVTNYALGNAAVLYAKSTSVDYCQLTPGVNAVFFVAPWNMLTPGPYKTISIAPPANASGVPLDLKLLGKAITDSDGTFYYLNAKWTKPNPPQPAATLNGYTMAVRCTNVNGYAAYSLDVPLSASTTNWTVSNVPKGGNCTVIMTANWSRTIPLNYVAGSTPIPLQ